MTDIEWTLKQLRRMRDGINFIADIASTEPVTISKKAKFFDKLSEMDRTIDILMDMAKAYFSHKDSSQQELSNPYSVNSKYADTDSVKTLKIVCDHEY